MPFIIIKAKKIKRQKMKMYIHLVRTQNFPKN